MSAIKAALMTAITSVSWFVKALVRACVLAIALLVPLTAVAEPIELKLAFFASENSDTFRYGVKPFVDAVNAEGKGLVVIKVYPGGALGKSLAEQPGLVLEGGADMAWVVPGQTPYRFPDNDLLELPGLFHDVREGALTYTRMIAAKALGGYESFFVIGAYTAAPTIIHSRKPIGSLADLSGTENSQQQSDRSGGAKTLWRLANRHAGIEDRRRDRRGRHRRCHHGPDWPVRLRCRAGDDEPLPSGRRRRSAGAVDEPQEVRQLARSRESYHSQI